VTGQLHLVSSDNTKHTLDTRARAAHSTNNTREGGRERERETFEFVVWFTLVNFLLTWNGFKLTQWDCFKRFETHLMSMGKISYKW